jgi:NAD(P)H dehydrogenase (quinone)
MSEGVLIVYDSQAGLVEQMSTLVASGVREAGCKAVVEKCSDASPEDLLKYEAIIVGSPTYFAGPSAGMKGFIDSTWALRGQLEGRVGAAFTASTHIGGGNELTLRTILDFFMIHGMVIQGDPESDHFGAIAVAGDEGDLREAVTDTSGECHRLGRRVAQLAARLRA